MPPNRCLSIADAEQFVRGEFDDDSTRIIREHLAHCHACRRRLGTISRNLEFADQLSARLVQPVGDEESPSAVAPKCIGQYEIIRELGRGGMAVVYLARQRNPPRPVALKVLSVAQSLDRHHVRMLEREGRVLGLLRHPNLAAIYDAGQTDDGRPFLTMELVEGLPLPNYASRRQLSVRERVELFLPVCDAVAHAHQRGVIHRDLKPSNILIESSGQPKVLDFGLARLLESEDSAAATSVVSEVGTICGTIPYMSPEQISGQREVIDARSDVYSLGVVLYELLTGALPYAIDRANLPAAARTICESPPLRPGDRLRELRGDVETILLKALAKEPERRYATVPAFADDLRRFLRGEPIAARPATLGYQLRKLVTRHKAPFAVAGAAVVLLAVSSAALSVQAVRLERQRAAALTAQQQETAARREAERQAGIAGAVNSFLANMLAAANPERSGGDARERKVMDVLNGAAASLATAFTNQPEVEAAVRFALGDSYRALGQFKPAEEQLRRSLEIRRRVLPHDHDDVAQSLNKLARTLQELAQYDEAESYFREMYDIHLRLHGQQHDQTAKALNNLGWLMFLKGDLDKAETLLVESLTVRRALHGENHAELASPLNNLAIVLMRKERITEALPLFRKSLEIDVAHRGTNHPNVVYTTISLAMLLSELDQLAEARELLTGALAHLRQLLGTNHLNVAISTHNLGVVVRKQGELDEAERLFHAALDGFQRATGPDHPRSADTFAELALVQKSRGDLAAVETLQREALRIRQLRFAAGHRKVIDSLVDLAQTLHDSQRSQEAAELLAGALHSIEASATLDEALRRKVTALRNAVAQRASESRRN